MDQLWGCLRVAGAGGGFGANPGAPNLAAHGNHVPRPPKRLPMKKKL